jgi:hypothetical protein
MTGAQVRGPWDGLPAEAVGYLSPHLPALADEILETIAAEVPAYARPLEGAFGEAMRLGVEESLTQFVTMVRSPGTGRAPGRNVYMALGRGEAREGRSLEALLAAYRVGARVAWRRLAGIGLEAGIAPETLVLFAESIFAYIDELSAESAEGFSREQAERAGEADRRSAAVVELLSRAPAPEPTELAAAADAAGWRIPRQLAAVVWPAEAGSRPAARLPGGSLRGGLHGLRCAVIADPDGPGRREEIARALASTPAGMGTVVAPADAARSFRRAVAALDLARRQGRSGHVAADSHRVALLCESDRPLLEELAGERLAPLEGETPASRSRLEATLLAWLRHQGGVAAAAAELGVHAQTVRYRLGRLRELFGAELEDPDARFELELALRARSGPGA